MVLVLPTLCPQHAKLRVACFVDKAWIKPVIIVCPEFGRSLAEVWPKFGRSLAEVLSLNKPDNFISMTSSIYQTLFF
jgi:hypothetical protein